MTEEETIEALSRALARLGAAPGQDRIMASQLFKRARQIAAGRGLSDAAAIGELLAKVVAGRRGEYSGGAQDSGPPACDERGGREPV